MKALLPMQAFALLLSLCLLSSCAQPPPGAGQAVTPAIETLAEAGLYRAEIERKSGAITWIEPTAAPSEWSDTPEARTSVQGAVESAAPRLAVVDYAGLSLPAFYTVTHGFTVDEATFKGGKVEIEAYGKGVAGERWALYGWQGPEIPQRADRLLVQRWVFVYALYNMDAKAVTLLMPTVRGEVQE